MDVIVSLTTAGCPIRAHFEKASSRASRRSASPTVTVGFDVLSDQEKSGLAQRLGRQGGLPEGALAAGQERDLHRLRARAAWASRP